MKETLMKRVLSVLLLVSSTSVFANELFSVKKSHNPLNVLHYSAKMKDCKLKGISAYWYMGQERGQTQGLNIFEKGQFSPKIITLKDKSADFTIGALKKGEEKIADGRIRVEVIDCVAYAYVEIDGLEVQPIELYVDGRMSGLNWKTNYMTLKYRKMDGSIREKRFDEN